MFTVSVIAPHGPAGSFVVNTNLAVPEKLEGGVHVEVIVLTFEKVPAGVPSAVDHIALVAEPPKPPFNVTLDP
jgi:hypothetical protein